MHDNPSPNEQTPAVNETQDSRDQRHGWRINATDQLTVAVIALVAVPLIWHAARLAERAGGHEAPIPSLEAAKAARILRQPAFWALALGFSMLALNHGMMLTHLLPLLAERGMNPQTGVLAISVIGPMQVIGRLVMLSVERRVSSMAIALTCQASLAVAALCLLGASAIPALLVPFVIAQGAGNGVTSIIRPVLTAELLGRKDFGVISGLTATIYIAGFALGPSVGSLLWLAGGYDLMLWLAVAMNMIGAVLLLAARNTARPVQG